MHTPRRVKAFRTVRQGDREIFRLVQRILWGEGFLEGDPQGPIDMLAKMLFGDDGVSQLSGQGSDPIPVPDISSTFQAECGDLSRLPWFTIRFEVPEGGVNPYEVTAEAIITNDRFK